MKLDKGVSEEQCFVAALLIGCGANQDTADGQGDSDAKVFRTVDEITAVLNPEMVHEVLQVVLNLARSGSTMLIVTHEMAFAKAIADRILFLEHGEIVEESHAPKEFFEAPKTERPDSF